jgi:hypothetical protein
MVNKKQHIAFVMLLALMLVFAFSVCVFADEVASGGGLTPEGAIEEGIGAVSEKAYNIIKVATLAVAVVFFAYNAFKAILGGEKGMENAKRNMYYIGVAVVIVFLAPMIVNEIYQMMGNLTAEQANNIFHQKTP